MEKKPIIEPILPATQELPKVEPPKERIRIQDLQSLFPTVTTAPTNVPRNFYEQIAFYKSGSTYRIYFYTDSWHFILLT